MTKPKAVVIDLDNTLALIGDRDPNAGHLCASDTLCEATALAMGGLAHGMDLNIIILTGRNEMAREATEQWLWCNDVAYHHDLIMRDPSDWRPAAEYKAAMLDERILPSYDVVLALDDDPTVVRAFRDRGIVAWHVREPLETPAALKKMAFPYTDADLED